MQARCRALVWPGTLAQNYRYPERQAGRPQTRRASGAARGANGVLLLAQQNHENDDQQDLRDLVDCLRRVDA